MKWSTQMGGGGGERRGGERRGGKGEGGGVKRSCVL